MLICVKVGKNDAISDFDQQTAWATPVRWSKCKTDLFKVFRVDCRLRFSSRPVWKKKKIPPVESDAQSGSLNLSVVKRINNDDAIDLADKNKESKHQN